MRALWEGVEAEAGVVEEGGEGGEEEVHKDVGVFAAPEVPDGGAEHEEDEAEGGEGGEAGVDAGEAGEDEAEGGQDFGDAAEGV